MNVRRARNMLTMTEAELARGWRYQNGTICNGVEVRSRERIAILCGHTLLQMKAVSTLGRLGSLFSTKQ